MDKNDPNKLEVNMTSPNDESNPATIPDPLETSAVLKSSDETTQVIYKSYNAKASKRLGIAQIVCGALAFILNIVGFILSTQGGPYMYSRTEEDDRLYQYYWRETYAYYAHSGEWAGIIVVGCGISALCSARTRSLRALVAQAVLSVLGALCGTVMIGLSVWALYRDFNRLIYGLWGESYRDYEESLYKYAMPAEAMPRSIAILVTSCLFAIVSLEIFGICVRLAMMSCTVIKAKDMKKVCCTAPCSCFLHLSCHDESGQPTILVLGSEGVRKAGVIRVGTKEYSLYPISDTKTVEETEAAPLLENEIDEDAVNA